jgi:hypothetical protein
MRLEIRKARACEPDRMSNVELVRRIAWIFHSAERPHATAEERAVAIRIAKILFPSEILDSALNLVTRRLFEVSTARARSAWAIWIHIDSPT